MSVNALNPAEPQKKFSPLSSAFSLGVLGGTCGYFAGGKRPTLENILNMKPDRQICRRC